MADLKDAALALPLGCLVDFDGRRGIVAEHYLANTGEVMVVVAIPGREACVNVSFSKVKRA